MIKVPAAVDWSIRGARGGLSMMDRLSLLVKIADKGRVKTVVEVVNVDSEKDLNNAQQEELRANRASLPDVGREIATALEMMDAIAIVDKGKGNAVVALSESGKDMTDALKESFVKSSLLDGAGEFVIAPETTHEMKIADKGKAKAAEVHSDNGDDMCDAQIEKFVSSLLDVDRELVVAPETTHGVKTARKGKGKAMEGVLDSNDDPNYVVKIHGTTVKHNLNRPLPALRIGPPESPRSNTRIAKKNEDSRRRNLEIARRCAAHFARCTDKKDKPSSSAVPAILGSIDSDRFDQILAQVTADVGRPDYGKLPRVNAAEILAQDHCKQGPLPSPYGVARQVLEGVDSTRPKPKCPLEWVPSRQPDFGGKRPTAKCLHDICVEVLCANIEFVESLAGLPDVTKTLISVRLCARRMMTPNALRLYFLSEPDEIIVPDCTLITEETLTEAFANWSPSRRIKALELGLCGRALQDKLCTSTLAEVAPSLSTLHTMILTGAYRLTDKGLTALVNATPNLSTLKLDHCNLISTASIQAVSNSSCRLKLKALSLESCSQLNASKLLSVLTTMPKLESLSLSGHPGMSDWVISELSVYFGSRLRELSIANCPDLTDFAFRAISFWCPGLTVLDMGHLPLLTDVAIESLANSCRTLVTLRLDRGKFSDYALASLITASGNCLAELSLSGVRQTGHLTLGALAEYSKGTLEQLDLSFCRAVSDQALGHLADSCLGLREIRLFGCATVTNLFLEGHSNSRLTVIGLPNAKVLDATGSTLKPFSKLV